MRQLTRSRLAGAGEGVPPRRSDEALRFIVGMIFEGRLPPGARLPSERRLSDRLGVSRTSLRDAINRLEARGYVERRPKSGCYVCAAVPRSVREPIEQIIDERVVSLSEIIELRKVLEVWAAGKAALGAGAGSIKRLKEALAAMGATARLRTEAELGRHRDADLKFHQVLASATGNPIYVHLMTFLAGLIGDSISISRRLLASDFGRLNLEKHTALFDAIRAKDAAAARDAMRDHFAFVETRMKPARPKLCARGRATGG